MRRNVAVILAGGIGQRAGLGGPKQLQVLADGRTVLETCVSAFAACRQVDEIVVVMHADHIAKARQILSAYPVTWVAGGRERWESSWNAIRAVRMNDELRMTNVLLHDCARPFVSKELIERVCEALKEHEAVTVAVPMTDTLYRVQDGQVEEIPERKDYMRAQTPQAFRIEVIEEAYKRALADEKGIVATDDCGIMRRYKADTPIYIIEGEETNRKLTYKEDFE